MSIKILKATLAIFFALAFLCVGLYFGSRIERKDRAMSEASFELVDMIAVVNLDEGVVLEDEMIYYSRDFLIYPDANFISTGVEDARQGINQGRYAAYLIIPADFSRSIASINGTPQKSILEYAINPNLEEGVKEKTIADIQEFHLLLNTNIAYVFVSSILSEFHSSQDATVIVLANDKNELAKLSAVESEKLLHELVYSDLEQLDYDLEELDVSQQFSDSEQLVNQMAANIIENVGEGVNEFEQVKNHNDIFRDSSRDLFQLLDIVTPGQTLSGDLVYEYGLNELEQAIDIFNTDQVLKRSAISEASYEAANQYRTSGEEYLAERLPHLQDDIDLQSLNLFRQMQEEVDEALFYIQQENHVLIQEELEQMEQERLEDYQYLQSYINQQLEQVLLVLKEVYEQEANQQLVDILEELGVATPSQAIFNEATPSNVYRITLATASNVEIDMSESGLEGSIISGRLFPLKRAVSGFFETRNPQTDIWIALRAIRLVLPNDFFILPFVDQLIFDALAIKIEELYLLSIDIIKNILQEDVIERIENENIIQKTEIEIKLDNLKANMDSYENSIENFDPYLYVHVGEITSIVREVNQNIGTIDRSVYEKTNQDRMFVDQVYDLIGKNTDSLQEDIARSNEQTLLNIINTVDILQDSRKETNRENAYLLEDFTRKLSYTRVGSIGNKDAYDFIVNPVTIVHKEESKSTLFQLDSNLERYLFAGALLMAVSIGGIITLAASWLLQKHRKNEANNSLNNEIIINKILKEE